MWLLVRVRNGWWGFTGLPQRLARTIGSEPRISVTWDNILLFSVGENIITMIIMIMILNTILTMIISMIMIINTILILIMVMIIIMVMVSQF